jgi:hypothetical protein
MSRWRGFTALPPRSNQLFGEPVGMMNQRRKALRTDMGFVAGKAKDNDRKILL